MFRLDRALEEEIYWTERTNPKLLTEFMKCLSKSTAQGTWPKQKQMAAVLCALRQADQLITEEGRKKYEEIRKEKADE